MTDLAGAIQRFTDPGQRGAVESAAFAALGHHPSFPGQLQRALDARAERLEGQREIWQRELEPIAQRQALEEASGNDAAEQIAVARGSGQPLPENVRAMLEVKWNVDLSKVRVHLDSSADGISRKLNAKALTSGQDIFFRAGTWNPTSLEGLQLIAHETWHTQQQANGLVQKGVDRDAGLETEARGKGSEVSSADLTTVSNGTGRVTNPVKPASPRATRISNAVQREKKASSDLGRQTTDAYVTAFKAALKKEVLNRLDRNTSRLNAEQDKYANPNANQPAWQQFHLLAGKDAQLLETRMKFAAQIPTLLRAAKLSSAAIPAMLMQPSTSLRAYKEGFIKTLYNDWVVQDNAAHPAQTGFGNTPAATRARLERFNRLVAPIKDVFDHAGRVEEARDFLHAQYPALAVLSKNGASRELAAQSNTTKGNAALSQRMKQEFGRTKGIIASVRGKISSGYLPVLELDVVTRDVLKALEVSNERRQANDPRSSAVLNWLDGERGKETALDLSLLLAQVGLTAASFFAPGFAIPLALVSGGAAARGVVKSSAVVELAEVGQYGEKLTSTEVDQARFAHVFSVVNAVLAVAMPLAAGLKSVRFDFEDLTDGSRQLMTRTSGAVRLGPAIPARVQALETAITDLKVPADIARHLRGYGNILEKLEGLGVKLSDLVEGLPSNTRAAQSAFRGKLRDACVNAALKRQGEEQMVALQELLGLMPNSKMQGELFTLFRQRTMGANFQGLRTQKSGELRPANISTKRTFDDVLQVRRAGGKGAPPPGRYAVEDKSGSGAYKPDQAQRYSAALERDGKITMKTGDEYEGVIYFFDTQKAYEGAIKTLKDMHAKIHVAYYNDEGILRWMR